MSRTKTKADTKAQPHLTLMQSLFVDAYLGEAHGNATLACRKAGYKGSDNSLRAIGCQNLRKVNIAKRIEERKAELARYREITPEWCREQARKRFQACIKPRDGADGPGADETNAKGYLDMLGRMTGAYEADNNQRGLNSLSSLALRLIEGKDHEDEERKALPVDSTVIDAPKP